MSAQLLQRRWPLYACVTVFTLSVGVGVTLTLPVVRPFVSLQGEVSGQDEKLVLPPVLGETGGLGAPVEHLVTQGDRLLSEGSLTSATTLYERALMQGNDVPDGSALRVLRKLFFASYLQGNREKAEETLGLLAFHGVSETDLQMLRGFLLLRDGDLAGARSTFDLSVSSDERRYGMLLLQMLAGEHEGAEASLQLLAKSFDPLLSQTARVIQGAYDEFALFEDGVPTHLQTLLAQALSRSGQCPVSQLLLEDVLENDSLYRDAWIVLGYCLLLLENPPEAISAFEHAYSLDPEKAETQYFLGLAHDRGGDRETARTFYEYALQNTLSPARPARERLATLARERGDNEEAASHYRTLLDGEGAKDPLLYSQFVSLLMEEMRAPDEAAGVAEQAREIFGDSPEVLDLLGWVALMQGKLDEAATFLALALESHPLPASVWYHKGMLQEQQGLNAEALESYRQAYDLSVVFDGMLAQKAAEKYNNKKLHE